MAKITGFRYKTLLVAVSFQRKIWVAVLKILRNTLLPHISMSIEYFFASYQCESCFIPICITDRNSHFFRISFWRRTAARGALTRIASTDRYFSLVFSFRANPNTTIADEYFTPYIHRRFCRWYLKKKKNFNLFWL